MADQSPATRRRWQWTWVGDDSVGKKAGQMPGEDASYGHLVWRLVAGLVLR
jgi:hypothetical protein